MTGEELTGVYRQEWDAVKARMEKDYKKVWELDQNTGTILDAGRSKAERDLDVKYRAELNDILIRAEATTNK
jgi:hypothetical protein